MNILEGFRKILPKSKPRTDDIEGKNQFTLDVLMTLKCNLRCTYCLQDHDAPEESHWTLKNLNKIAHALAQNPNATMSLIGGEPLLKSRLVKKFLSQDNLPDIQYRLITNGLLLTPEIINLVFSKPRSFVGISVDTISTDNTRKLSLPQMLYLMKMIRYIADNHGAYRTTVYVSVIPSVICYLHETLSILYDTGARNFVLNIIFNPDFWSDSEFDHISQVIKAFCIEHPTVIITFAESHEPGSRIFYAVSSSGRITSSLYQHQEEKPIGHIDFDNDRMEVTPLPACTKCKGVEICGESPADLTPAQCRKLGLLAGYLSYDGSPNRRFL